jgi:hypothetical protein
LSLWRMSLSGRAHERQLLQCSVLPVSLADVDQRRQPARSLRRCSQQSNTCSREAGRPSFAIMRTDCIDRHVRGSDNFVSTIIWTFGPAAFATAACMAGPHRTSECGMDRPSIDRSLRLERAATLYHSRSRRRLWSGFHSTPQSYGHTRPPDLSSIGLAERVIGSIRRDCLDHGVLQRRKKKRIAIMS